MSFAEVCGFDVQLVAYCDTTLVNDFKKHPLA